MGSAPTSGSATTRRRWRIAVVECVAGSSRCHDQVHERRGGLMDSMRSLLSDPAWLLRQDGLVPEEHGFYESLFSLSNGYMGVRHTVEFESEETIPGCFLADVYDVGVGLP